MLEITELEAKNHITRRSITLIRRMSATPTMETTGHTTTRRIGREFGSEMYDLESNSSAMANAKAMSLNVLLKNDTDVLVMRVDDGCVDTDKVDRLY